MLYAEMSIFGYYYVCIVNLFNIYKPINSFDARIWRAIRTGSIIWKNDYLSEWLSNRDNFIVLS